MKSNSKLIKVIGKVAKTVAIAGLTFGLIPGAAAADSTTTGTLNLVTVVVNSHNGVSAPSDFEMHVWSHLVEITGSPMPGMDGAGRTYVLPVGSYIVTQSPHIGYRGMWSGPVTFGGTVVIEAGSTLTVTRTVYDVADYTAPVTPSEPVPATPAPTATTPATPTPATPTPTEEGGTLPNTATPFGNILLLGGALALTGGIGLASRKALVK